MWGITCFSGSKVFDAIALKVGAWREKNKKFLPGTYRVIVWLLGTGSPENRIMLFNKSFVFKMSFNVSIAPTVWTSWNEVLKVTITNTGDVPLVVPRGFGMELPETGTVIGWVRIPQDFIIMPGESKEIIAQVEVVGSHKEWLKGKDVDIDFWIPFEGANEPYKMTLKVSFPRE